MAILRENVAIILEYMMSMNYILIVIDYKEAVFAISLGILYSYKYFNVNII